MVSGILIAMAVVGAVGLFIGLFLGIAGIKFKVEVDVQIWRQQLPKGKRRSMPVRWAVSRLEKRSQRSWA